MKFRYTMKELEDVNSSEYLSDIRLLHAIVNERKSDLNVYTPLSKRLSNLHHKLDKLEDAKVTDLPEPVKPHRVFLAITQPGEKKNKGRTELSVYEIVNGELTWLCDTEYSTGSNPGTQAMAVQALVKGKHLPENKLDGHFVNFKEQDYQLIMVEGKARTYYSTLNLLKK